jgi:hypothetical protein
LHVEAPLKTTIITVYFYFLYSHLMNFSRWIMECNLQLVDVDVSSQRECRVKRTSVPFSVSRLSFIFPAVKFVWLHFYVLSLYDVQLDGSVIFTRGKLLFMVELKILKIVVQSKDKGAGALLLSEFENALQNIFKNLYHFFFFKCSNL